MLPRGEITRDQLSALLLGYVGTAADTLELFEVFEEEQLKGKLAITQAVVGVFCWSLLQFTLVTTATTGKDNQIKITSHKVRNYCLVYYFWLGFPTDPCTRLYSGHLTGCSSVESHPTVKSASAAS